jgi:hypothetical protein
MDNFIHQNCHLALVRRMIYMIIIHVSYLLRSRDKRNLIIKPRYIKAARRYYIP